MNFSLFPPISPSARAILAGGVSATLLLTAVLHSWSTPGPQVPPSLSNTRFTVAVMSGPKQAAQAAPENADQTAPDVATAPPQTASAAITAERPTSLPKAVQAAQDAVPGEAAEKEEVLPPARVAMPGGKLAVEDASMGGGAPGPFAMGPRQVFIRIFIDADGRVLRGGIVRSGGEPLRDQLILKAMMTRSYTPDRALRVAGSSTLQIDLVLDYGTQEMLP